MRQPNNSFSVEKLPVETLVNLLMNLYDNGVDYVDLSSDNSNPFQHKLIITTRKGYINPKYYNEEGLQGFEMIDDDDTPKSKKKKPPKPNKLSDDDIEKLL